LIRVKTQVKTHWLAELYKASKVTKQAQAKPGLPKLRTRGTEGMRINEIPTSLALMQ
jgi:hypothetical protein